MDNLTNFDKLIINLSSVEKKEMLEKMEMTFELSQEPLVEQMEMPESDFKNFQSEYETLNIVQKIYIFLQSLVLQRDIPTLLKEHKVMRLRKKYFHDCDLADFKNGLLKQPFYNELIKLKDPCRFFRKPLHKIFSFDNKQDFYAFIGGVILPDLQQELLIKTNPWELEKKDEGQEVSLIKSEIDTFMDMKMDSISDLDRSIMNEACQSLYGLHLLCSFDLNMIIKSFESVTPESGNQCLVADVQDLLFDLAGILRALNRPPSIRAVEALFLYALDGEDLKTDLNKKMSAADTLLSVIRDFNKKVPLENLVKVLSGDLSKSSRKPPVVEDWFRIYRKFWAARINVKYTYYVNERKKNESEKNICSITGVRYIKPIERYTRNYYFDGSPAKYEKSIAFVRIFLEEIFPRKFHATLMIISREGEFYKKDNKAEFEKVLSYFGELEKKMKMVETLVNGDLFSGKNYSNASTEEEEQKRISIINAIEQLDFEAHNILDGFVGHMRILNKVLNGIVIGDGGAYDTLSNISSIGGAANSELRETFKFTALIINKITKYISEMKILEEKRL